MDGAILAVSLSSTHTFSKENQDSIRLLAGMGVEGDAHSGETVKHRSRVARDPTQPNLRQVHLMHSELLDELQAAGHTVLPSQMGENITTKGVDLLNLPLGTQLHLGGRAVIEITGLRNPCEQMNNISPGLLDATLSKDEAGQVRPLSGVMAIVLEGGTVEPDDSISVEFPPEPHKPLDPV
ncbi:MAG: MOSC domain-containing protein [Candidatus Latescibacterota bacterium]|nr:MOSC domain-containing protein [Candidatus Latescibacterota bacterium]